MSEYWHYVFIFSLVADWLTFEFCDEALEVVHPHWTLKNPGSRFDYKGFCLFVVRRYFVRRYFAHGLCSCAFVVFCQSTVPMAASLFLKCYPHCARPCTTFVFWSKQMFICCLSAFPNKRCLQGSSSSASLWQTRAWTSRFSFGLTDVCEERADVSVEKAAPLRLYVTKLTSNYVSTSPHVSHYVSTSPRSYRATSLRHQTYIYVTTSLNVYLTTCLVTTIISASYFNLFCLFLVL